jgi:WD40 repeat protein
MSTLFISHSSKDNSTAKHICAKLFEAGHQSIFLDFDPDVGIQAGVSWERTLYTKLRSCRAVIALCSDNYIASQWCFAEVALARMEGKQVFVLQIDPWSATTHLPSILTEDQCIDLSSDPEDGYRRLWNGFRSKGIVSAAAREWSPATSPYPGLRAFQEEDAPIFFGRDAEILEGCELLNRVRRQGYPRLVLVLGSSGSGKSSLVRAGLVPRLKKDSAEWFVVPPFRPGPQPTEKLAAALAQAFSEKGEHLAWDVVQGWLQSPRKEESDADEVVEAGPGPAESIQAARERLMQALDAIESQLSLPDDQVIHYLRKLREYLSKPDPGTEGVVGSAVTSPLVSVLNRLQRIGSISEATVVLVIDQFEELLGHDADHPATRFVELLRQVLMDEHCPLLIIGTMRSDFLGVLQACSSLQGMGFSSFSVGPMGREGMRQIVEEPAVLGQIQLESGLTDRLLNDTGTADALPLLAFTLRMLWDRHHDRHQFTISDYLAFGGLQGALAQVADHAYDDVLDKESDADARQALAEDLRRAFLAMARPAIEGRGWARQPLDWEPLPHTMKVALAPFIDPHRLLIKQEGDSLEVAHEALFRSWERLRAWLNESGEALLLRHEIQGEAIKWRDAGTAEEQDPYLFRGGRLARALELRRSGLLTLEDSALAFLEASDRADQARKAAELALQHKQAEDEARLRTSEERAGILQEAVVEGERERGKLVRQGRRIFLSLTSLAALIGLVTAFALRALSRAQLATALEQASVTRMNSYQDDQLTALTGAMSDAFRLRGAVGDIRQIAGYPSIAPLTALWIILAGSWEQQRVSAHRNGLDAIAMAADGRIASVGHDDRLALWQADGRLMLTVPILSPQAVLFGEEGRSLVVATADGAILLVPLGNGVRRQWSAHPGVGINAMAPGPQPGSLATAGGDGLVAVWSREGRQLARWRAAPQADGVMGIAVDRRHGRVATVGERGGAVRIWSSTGQAITTLIPPGSAGETTSLRVAFDPAGRLITTDSTGGVLLWTLNASARDATAQQLSTAKIPIRSLAVMADGRVLAGDAVGRIHVWNGEGKLLVTLKGHQGTVTSLAAEPGGQRFVSGDDVGGWRQWRQPPRAVESLVVGQTAVNSLRFHPSKPELALALGDGSVQIRSAQGRLHQAWSTRKGGHLSSLDILPGGEELVVAGSTGRVRLWTWGGEEGQLKRAETASVTAVRVTRKPDGKILAGSGDGSLWIWSLRGEGRKRLEAHPGGTHALAVHPSGERFASTGQDGRVRIWSEAGDAVGGADLSKQPLAALGYSPDGKRLAAAGHEGRLFLLDQRGGVQRSFPTYQTRITALAFAPGQELIASAGSDGSLKLWDYSGRPVFVADENLGHTLYGLDFDPVGANLAAAGEDGRLIRVRISSLNGLLRRGCSWLADTLQRDETLLELKNACRDMHAAKQG